MFRRRGRLAQIRSDVATDVFRHLATCTTPDTTGGKPAVTVIVRIDLDSLQSGVGVGQIDGIPTPVSAGTVRRMAADAHLIPAVLGTHSEVLDLGRKHRLFSRAQKLALAERDGGCAWTGCPHPPSLHRSPPHPLVGHRPRPHQPEQRDPVLQQPPPPGPPGQLGHPGARQRPLLHPTRTHRPPPATPTRRTHPHPHRRMNFAATQSRMRNVQSYASSACSVVRQQRRPRRFASRAAKVASR